MQEELSSQNRRWGLPGLGERLVFLKKTILILAREEEKEFFFIVVLELQLDSEKKKKTTSSIPMGWEQNSARLLCAQKTAPMSLSLAQGAKHCPQQSHITRGIIFSSCSHSLIKVRCIAENKQPLRKDVWTGDNIQQPIQLSDLRSHLCCYSFLGLSLSDSGSRGNYQGPV